MSKQTEALKMALEALLGWGKGFPDNWGDLDTEAVNAIREALAQSRSDVEQPAQQQEPVGAVTVSHYKGLENNDFDYWGSLPDGTHNLYTSPPASKPLTDEQIDRAIAELGLNYLADAANNRAVLRELCRKAAHGIKE